MQLSHGSEEQEHSLQALESLSNVNTSLYLNTCDCLPQSLVIVSFLSSVILHLHN